MAVPVSVEADHDSPASVEGSGDINHVVDELTDFMTAPNPGLRAVAVKNMVCRNIQARSCPGFASAFALCVALCLKLWCFVDAHITLSQFSLTGSRDYLTVFRGNSKPVEAFVTVIRGEIIPNIKKDAYNALINLSSDAIVAEALVRHGRCLNLPLL